MLQLLVVCGYGFLANLIVRIVNILFMKVGEKSPGEMFIYISFGIVILILAYNALFSLFFTQGSKYMNFGVLDTLSVFFALVLSFGFQYYYFNQTITLGQFVGLGFVFVGVIIMNFLKI